MKKDFFIQLMNRNITKNSRRTISLLVSAFLASSLITFPAAALTAQDVLEKMDNKESWAYLTASIEMAAFLAKVRGDIERSACIMKWWFDTSEAEDKVITVFARFPDRAPQPILYVLMNKACGKPMSAAK